MSKRPCIGGCMSNRNDQTREAVKSQPPDGITPRPLNITDAAKYMSCSVWFVRKIIWRRRIPFVKFGKGYQLDRSDLDKYIDSEKQRGEPSTGWHSLLFNLKLSLRPA